MRVIATHEPSAQRPRLPRRPAPLALLTLCTALLLLAVLTSSAHAAPPTLWTACPPGSAAGQCSIPRGIAANPKNGHLFVANQFNRRIEELDPLGNFVKAWGWGVATGAAQLEVCTEASTCQAGLQGSGTGQFSAPQGVALDSAGAVYVVDHGLSSNSNRRVQKFSPSGQFLLMFGGEVNKTKVDEGTATEAEENLCPYDPVDQCQKGTQGTGQGQFGAWPFASFIAIDRHATASTADDDVYVGDVGRIQRFNTVGEYQGEIALPGQTVQSLAVDAAGNLYYGTGDKAIHKLSPAGALLPPTFEVPKLSETAPFASAITLDPAGDLYAFGPTQGGGNSVDPIFKFDPSGNLLEHFGKEQFNFSTGLATNLCTGSAAPGNLYVSNGNQEKSFIRAYGTDPDGCFNARTGSATNIAETAATLNGTINPRGQAVSACRFQYGSTTAYGSEAPCAESPAQIGSGEAPVPVHADVSGLAGATTYHFRLRATILSSDETAPDASFKTLGPPVISEAHTVSATSTEATIAALVNPEGLPTSCHFEYGPTVAYGLSTEELSVGSDRTEHPAQAVLEGLAPATAYHWRALCDNSAVLDQGTTAGPDRTLATYQPFAAQGGCANEAFRYGASASLPDCRAYEMVSPLDKNGGDIVGGLSSAAPPESGRYIQSTPEGDKITYTSAASFAGEPNSFLFNQYLAERTERGEPGEGWGTQGIHPPVGGRIMSLNPGFNREFMAFTVDLCSAWLIDYQSPPPSPDGQEGFFNLFRRDNCAPGAGTLEALVSAPPLLPEGTSHQYVTNHSVQGISADGRHALFVAEAKLTEDAREDGVAADAQIYDRFDGALSLVSVLPDSATGDPAPGNGEGFASPGNSEVGSSFSRGNLEGAVSEDGSRVYWTEGAQGRGAIYLREHPEQGIVPDECEGANACTHKVSVGSSAFFWQGSSDGASALFGEAVTGGEDLYLFDLARLEAEEAPRLKIASGAIGVLGASEDLSRVYFASRQALPGTGGVAGKPNVYLYEAGPGGESIYELVATVGEGDVGAVEPDAVITAYSLAGNFAVSRATRVTPDGSRLAFNSRAPLTEYDNTDSASGKPAVEVFLYDAEADELACVSCNPSGARPRGAVMRQPYARPQEDQPTGVIGAAWIPTWEHPNHASNVLSAGGGRLFFNASDALLPRDANGAQDVYQWEAPSVGSCTTDSSSYFPRNGGCVDLVSSGQSPHESEFWEASADGRDVFFTTTSSLLPQDPGLVDLYDARVEGGFPQPAEVSACEGEACQGPFSPPDDPTPASSSFEGAGNVVEPPAKSRCGKGKVRRHGRCVRKHRKHRRAHRRRANHDRRAAR